MRSNCTKSTKLRAIYWCLISFSTIFAQELKHNKILSIQKGQWLENVKNETTYKNIIGAAIEDHFQCLLGLKPTASISELPSISWRKFKSIWQQRMIELSLAYDIVKAHGGELKVESKEGGGATFVILLPSSA